MILEKLIVGPVGTNCYIFGSKKTKGAVIIDLGGEPERILNFINDKANIPIGLLLTHGHFDHVKGLRKILRSLDIPLMYNIGDKNSIPLMYNIGDKKL